MTIDLALRAAVSRSVEMARWYVPHLGRKETVPLYWWRDVPNVGDRVSPHIVQHVLGAPVVPALAGTKRKLLGCGSVLHYARDGDSVWGSGAISAHAPLRARDLAVCSVRGPLSRRRLLDEGLDCPECYGDPALLLPLVFPADRSGRRWDVGLIPHFVDLDECRFADPTIKILDVRRPLKLFLRDLWRCTRVVSSSLHGIIFAEAYGIPAAWMALSDRVVGDGFKFRDYYLGTGREPMHPLSATTLGREQPWTAPAFDRDRLIAALFEAADRLPGRRD